MPVIGHISHHGSPGALPTHGHGSHEPRQWSRAARIAASLGLAVIFVLLAVAYILHRVGSTPSDTAVDARLAAVQRQMAARRARAPREGTAAGVAGRILGAESSRGAQREWMKDPDEQGSDTAR
jgi:hypothetical protein